MFSLGQMLSFFQLSSVNGRVGYGRDDSKVKKGYKASDIAAAVTLHQLELVEFNKESKQ